MVEARYPEEWPPVPGDNHPAVAHLASTLAGERSYSFKAPVSPVASASPAAEDDSLSPSFPTILTFTAETAAQSLYPEYGVYRWRVWRDQYGRHVTEPKATWVENPQGLIYGEWNPGVESADG